MMELGAVDAEDAIQLPRAEIPLELQKNFTGLRNVPLFYANYCRKLSHKNKVQNRVLIATLDHLYLCHPNGDILRCFPFSFVERIFHDPERKQVGIVVPREYDLLLALVDSFHLVHVIHSLRTLHTCETPLIVEIVKRRKMKHIAGDKSKGSGMETSEDEPRSRIVETDNRSVFQKIVGLFIYRPPPGVIIGWNDAFVNAEDDGSGENVVGSESEVCIGKGYYSLRLMKPEDFQLNLYNVASEGI